MSATTAAVRTLPRRFWSKVDRQEGPVRPGELGPCWPWLRYRDEDGYGVTAVDRRTQQAHRVAFILSGGVLTDEKPQVLHRCDNPCCCNPDHLWAGTNNDNVADKIAKGRQASGDRTGSRMYPERRPRGEIHRSARLRADQVLQIRVLSRDGWNQRSIARRFDISQRQVGNIIHGRQWRCLP